MELSLRYFWAIFLFFLAFLHLSSRLATQAAASSALADDLDFVIYRNDTWIPTYDNCQGLWSCASALCRLLKMDNVNYLTIQLSPDNINREHCGVQGMSWIVQWSLGRSAIAFLILAVVFQIASMLVTRLPRYVLYALSALAYLFLVLAYIFEFAWTHRYVIETADRQPGMVVGWNISFSIFLLIGVLVANLSLIPPKEEYQPIN